MTEQELHKKLNQLRNLQAENEIVEFKEAKSGYDFSKLGKYFSALCNEANMQKVKCAWLVFGVENNEHKIVGTNFRTKRSVNQRAAGPEGEVGASDGSASYT